MRWLVLALFAGVSFAQPVISNVVLLQKTHSCVTFAWDTDVAPDKVQIVYGPTSSYGAIDAPYQNRAGGIGAGNTRQYASCGHVPGSTVHFSPQSKVGVTLSNTIDQSITFDAAPNPDPALPVDPTPVSVAMPDVSGYSTVTITNCPDFPAALNSAISTRISGGGTIIKIPTTGCDVPFTLLNPDPQAVQFFAANVNTGTNIFTITHPFVEGQRIRFSGDNYNTNGAIPAPLLQAKDYCAVTVVLTVSFQVADWPGCGTPIDITSTGSDGAEYVMQYPPTGSFVQIRSAAADSALPPDGVQINSEWATSIAPLRGTALGIGPTSGMFRTGPFTGNLIWGPGLQFDVADPGAAWVGTTDPIPINYWFDMKQLTSAYWIFDRTRFVTGWPKRIWLGFYLNGSDLSFVNSEFYDTSYGMSYWSGYSMAAPAATMTATSSGASAGAGSYFTCPSLPTFSITLTGATGTGTAYADITSACTIRVTLQSGVTATCSGCSLNVGTDFPRNAGGSYSGIPIFRSLLSASSWGTSTAFPNFWIYNFDSTSTSQYVFDGSTMLNGTYGYGPLLIQNTTFTDAGIIPIHFDESTTIAGRFWHDMTLNRLRFSWTPSHVYAWAYGVNPLSNGLRYVMRQQVECKLCARIKFNGVSVTGNYGDYTTAGWGLEMLSTAGSGPIPNSTLGSSDISILNTSIMYSAACLSLNGNQPGSFQIGLPLARVRISNFICANNNAYLYSTAVGGGRVDGNTMSNSLGGEDYIIENSTFGSNPGSISDWTYMYGSNRHGATYKNNIFTFNGTRLGLAFEPNGEGVVSTPNCFIPATNAAILGCFHPSLLTWTNNILLAGYTDSQNSTGDIDAVAVKDSYVGLAAIAYIPQQATYSLRLAAMKYYSFTDFRLRPDSPLQPGATSPLTSDGSTIGANLDAMDDAKGIVKNVRVLTAATTTASVRLHAADASTACRIGYGASADVTTWTRTAANTTASQDRTIALSGLSGATMYFYQAWCAGSAPTATQIFTTKP